LEAIYWEWPTLGDLAVILNNYLNFFVRFKREIALIVALTGIAIEASLLRTPWSAVEGKHA